MSDEVLDDVLAICVLAIQEKRKRKRTLWMKKWLLKRPVYTHINILNELKFYPDDFKKYLRMDEATYIHLLGLVGPLIGKQSTVMRASISPHERLTATLRFLATGRNYHDLQFSTCISPSALCQIIPETCRAIYDSLVREYMKFPSSTEEWLREAQQFEDKWQFPNCLGAVDGKHVAISPPPSSGSYYFNYKGFHSMVLMAVANANYELLYVSFGTNGRVSDGGVIDGTDFYEKLLRGDLKLPQPNPRNGLPYVFISDEAFALREDFLKPYNVRVLDNQKRVFNYRLSRARRVVENVFGILVSRFGVLKSQINLQPQNIDAVVLACCVLHNFLRKNAAEVYTPAESLDFEDPTTNEMKNGLRAEESCVASLSIGPTRNAPHEAKHVRDKFMIFFNNEGKVPWQERYIFG